MERDMTTANCSDTDVDQTSGSNSSATGFYIHLAVPAGLRTVHPPTIISPTASCGQCPVTTDIAREDDITNCATADELLSLTLQYYAKVLGIYFPQQ
ncbi:hypothetical protein AOLI_G00240690 [Acnodon oligacanthus]